MNIYRFIGTETDIGGEKLKEFGQTITLSDSRAKEAIMGAGPEQGYAGATALIPDDDYQKLKITDEEQRQYAYPGRRERMSADFKPKYHAAFDALGRLREKYAKEDAKAAAEKAKEGKS